MLLVTVVWTLEGTSVRFSAPCDTHLADHSACGRIILQFDRKPDHGLGRVFNLAMWKKADQDVKRMLTQDLRTFSNH
jgi:hypothetical protein